MTLSFTKMNGAGNDFIMVDNRRNAFALTKEQIARLCDRHRGIGADGLIAAEPAQNGGDFRMRYYNADGGEAEMCGNGARCFARFASRLGGTKNGISFETIAGQVSAQLLEGQVRLQMSEPRGMQIDIPLNVAGEDLLVHFVNTGVPHAVVVVSDLESVDVIKLGRGIRFHDRFAPSGTNANFIRANPDRTLSIRTYERGVEGETLACGTGVCASALVFHRLTGAAAPVQVQVRGGETLSVDFQPANGGYSAVTLTGSADFVFDGVVEL